jgi:hypothetical protein
MTPLGLAEIRRPLPYVELSAPPNTPNSSSSNHLDSESLDAQQSTQSVIIERLQKLLLNLLEVQSSGLEVSTAMELDSLADT